MSAVFSSSENNVLIDLSGRFSSKINVIVESDNPQKAEETAKILYNKIDRTKIYTSDVNVNGVISDYEKFHSNLLSDNTRILLEKKMYSDVAQGALERLYNPIMPPIGSVENDPFLLLTDYVINLSSSKQIVDFVPTEINGKYYSFVMLNVDSDIALSPTILNDEVEKLVGLQKSLSYDGVKIYLTGTPIHSYFASSHSIFEINLISILSIIFVVSLVFWYFRSLKPLLPILLSIGMGVFSGYCVTALVFRDIHILTFVFSTTLIGICVDYSLHYFVSKCNIDAIRKSLTVGLLTTVSAFVVLLFADFILLRQISVFTITGLVVVYLCVVLFYPMFCKKFIFENRNIPAVNIPEKYFKPIIGVICLIVVFGFFRISFDDNIKNMYVPPKNLMKAEKLFAELTGVSGDISIFVVRGKNIQDLLRKEEIISEKLVDKNIEYQALSKYVPSIERQKSNWNLRKRLYEEKLNDFASFLPNESRIRLLKEQNNQFMYPNNNFDVFKRNFLIDENTSIMLVYNYDGESFDDVEVINFQRDISAQLKKCRRICLGLLVPIFAFLYLILAKIYNYRAGVTIILPSITAVAFVFGILGIFNCGVNLFHLLAVFLIIGFGLDYSVFRYNNAQKACDAVLLSCLTSVFSFALLAFAGFKLISSLGIVLALGLLSSYIFSLILIKDSEIKKSDMKKHLISDAESDFDV